MAAIYQWLNAGEVIFTTALYPLEISESLSFSLTVDAIDLVQVDEDEWNFTFDITGGHLEAFLLLGPTPDDAWNFSFNITGGDMESFLLIGPEPDDAWNFSFDVTDGDLQEKLIIAYMPDQGLIFAMDIEQAGTFMYTE